MKRLFVILALGLAACGSGQRPSPPSAIHYTDTTQITVRLENSWLRCLNQAYAYTHKQTEDRNAAAELAFEDCAAEEQDLASEPYSYMLMPHLKAETKHVLIDTDGHIPEVAPQ
jgi:hypothetical protein